jgi:dienelactone hydrolase
MRDLILKVGKKYYHIHLHRLVNHLSLILGLVLMVTLSGCGERNTASLAPTVQVAAHTPLATLSPTPTPTPTVPPSSTATAYPVASDTPTPTSTPTPRPTVTSTPTVTPTPTPHPLANYTIEGLRKRAYPGGDIQITGTITETDSFTKYLIQYPSDDLTITGMMNVPMGDGPFPVIILNHGYISPARFWSGADTWRAADHLATNGYLTISPDFRGWGGSDAGDNFFRTGLLIDVLNLVSSIPSLPQAEAEQVGMWGHSMGGGVTTKVITVDPRIKAAVLYAPVSADDTDVIRRWGRGRGSGAADSLDRAYQKASSDRDFLKLTSPIHYFSLVTAPVQIHQGTADTSTPPQWAEAIRDALQAAGKEMEYFSYPGQGHALQGESWDLFMQRVTSFFDQALKGNAENGVVTSQ